MINVNTISLCPNNIVITKGDWYYEICAIICPTDATCKCLTWNSSNSNVATVNEYGYIYAISEGTSTIYASAQDGSGVTGSCNVTVVAPIYVNSISITPSVKTANVGDSFNLSATVCPCNATDKRVRWSSCDCNIADVDALTGCVTAKYPGTTCIYANAIDGSGICASCEITINTVPIQNITLIPSNTARKIGDTFKPRVIFHPINATDKRIRWSSSNNSVAIVDANGYITAVGEGSTLIKATAWDGVDEYGSCLVNIVDKKRAVFLIHGRTSNSEVVWGAETCIKEGDNNHFNSDLYAGANNDSGDKYVERQSQRILRCSSEHEEGGNLAYFLEQHGYWRNLNLFVFNYPNEDPVIHDAKKFEKYIENVIDYVRTNGTDDMKACFYDSPVDYELNNYKFNIVAHSMGGLVGRYYIENLGHNRNVDKLITICTPHWGTGYADVSCFVGTPAHKICDHDLNRDSAIYGGSLTTYLDPNDIIDPFCCTEGPYTLTDELRYSKSRRTRYYAIAGIDYSTDGNIVCNDSNNVLIANAELCTTYSELFELIQAQTNHQLYKTTILPIAVAVNTYMDINSVGDNLVGFLSQIGWTEQSTGNYPTKRIDMEKVFIFIDTDGGNTELVGKILHNKIPHRNEAMNKVYEYLCM